MDNHPPPRLNFNPLPVICPFGGEMKKNYTCHEDDALIMSIDGIIDGMFHRFNSKSVEDEYWYTSSMKASTDHLLRLYRGYSWQNNLYLASEKYTCTLKAWINNPTTTITHRHGNRLKLNDNFQRMLRKIISSIHYFHAKGIKVGRVSSNNICVFMDGDSCRVKFKRLYRPASAKLSESDYQQDYQDLASMIRRLMMRKNIYDPPEDVNEMLDFMSDRFTLRKHCINLHMHPALLNERDRCMLRVSTYIEAEVGSGVTFSYSYLGWLDNVPPSLYKVLYFPNPPPCRVNTSRGHRYSNCMESFAKFCLNACFENENTTLSCVDLDQLLNGIVGGFLPSWFNHISNSGFKLSWGPK